MDDMWDGAERRAVRLADEQSKPNGKTVEIPLTTMIVGFVVVIILQVAALLTHITIDRGVHDEAGRSKAVDASLTCYVIKVSQGVPAGPEILTDCGFLPSLPILKE